MFYSYLYTLIQSRKDNFLIFRILDPFANVMSDFISHKTPDKPAPVFLINKSVKFLVMELRHLQAISALK